MRHCSPIGQPHLGPGYAYPREEHLLPLMVAAGASAEPGERDYGELVLGGAVSAFRFG